jgi:hypothetical protein
VTVRGRSILRLVVAFALGLWLLGASEAAVRHIGDTLHDAPRRIAQDSAAGEREFRGKAFVDAIEAIRLSIPKDGDYLLVEGRDNIADSHLVRAYLVPRKAEFLGLASSLDEDTRARLWVIRPPRYIVLAWTPAGVPVAGSTADLKSLLGPYPWSHETASLPGGVDPLPDDAVVRGPLLVRGWARIPGEDLQVQVEIDGEDRGAGMVRRCPRPDVCSVIPQMGDCTTAGFELKLELRAQDLGRHELVVVFRAADGRVRHYPGLQFEWRR